MLRGIFLLLMFSFLNSCGSKYILETDTILKFKDATFKSWSAGIKGGGTGYSITLKLNDSIDFRKKSILLKGIYFREKLSKLKKQNEGLYQAFISSKVNILSEEIRGGKTLPTKSNEKIPFNILDNEAVIVYQQKKKLKYYKLKLKQLKTIDFPM